MFRSVKIIPNSEIVVEIDKSCFVPPGIARTVIIVSSFKPKGIDLKAFIISMI